MRFVLYFFFISLAVPKLPIFSRFQNVLFLPGFSLSGFWVLNFVRKDDVPHSPNYPPKGNRLIRKEAASAPQRKIVPKSEETTNRGVPHCSGNFAHPSFDDRTTSLSPFEEENFSDSPIRVPLSLSLIWLFLNGTHVQFWILILKMTAVERERRGVKESLFKRVLKQKSILGSWKAPIEYCSHTDIVDITADITKAARLHIHNTPLHSIS